MSFVNPITRSRRVAPVIEILEARRLLSYTDVDLTFSGDGKTATDSYGSADEAHASAVQSDGKIVAVGSATFPGNIAQASGRYAAVIRYNFDGSIDDGSVNDSTPGNKFASNGKDIFLLGNREGSESSFEAVAIQSDGKIVLAGWEKEYSFTFNRFQNTAVIMRLNSNGTVDSSFANGGTFTTTFNSANDAYFKTMVIQKDGKIVAMGQVGSSIAGVRLTTSGALDNSFDGDGMLLANLYPTTQDRATSMALDHLGNLWVTAVAATGNTTRISYLLRFQPNGTPDNNFDADGRIVIGNGEVRDVAVKGNSDVAVAFYNFDSTHEVFRVYDSTGRIVLRSEDLTVSFRPSSLVVNADDSVMITGNVGSSSRLYYDINGGPTFSLGTSSSQANDLAIAPDGRLVVAGSGNFLDFGVARFQGLPSNTVGTVTGNVFVDYDGDKVRDSNEPGKGNVRVYLDVYNQGGYHGFQSVFTDPSGNYKLTGLRPGTVVIREVTPLTYSATLGSNGYTFNIAGGQTVTGKNFGNKPFGTNDAVSRIRGNVFNDLDLDGSRDVDNPIEPDLSGRVVFLDLNKNGVKDTSEPSRTTDASGNYLFDNLTPGSYRVRTVLPTDWYATNPSSAYKDVTVTQGVTTTVPFATAMIDPDDTIADVANRTGNIKKLGEYVDFNLDPAVDVDLIKFTVSAGQKVGFDVDSRNGSSLDTYLRLFNSSGTQLASNDNGQAPGESPSGGFSYLSYTFASAGTYYIGVSKSSNKAYNPATGSGDTWGTGSTGPYRLYLNNLGTTSLPTTVRVNAGGPQYTSTSGAVFEADNGFTGGTTSQSSFAVANTNDDPMYYTRRFGKSFSFSKAIANGTYTLYLNFAESYFTAAGQRTFDVFAEGKQILNDFDLVAAGGSKTAITKAFTVSVTDGKIDLSFAGVVGDAIISSIAVVKA